MQILRCLHSENMGRAGRAAQWQLFLIAASYCYQSRRQVSAGVRALLIVVFAAIWEVKLPNWAFHLNNNSHVQLFPVPD